mmetsp:Transcript_19136/g.22567  ORF Transcript_19136/g.22567 Transcript_19136/m.22567 type:complete len:121 (+) Transcript_19136:1-363(+)
MEAERGEAQDKRAMAGLQAPPETDGGILSSALNETLNSSMLSPDVEDEFALEEALSKLEGRLRSYREHSKVMSVSGRKYPLSETDPIYFLAGPTKARVKTETCHCCQSRVFQSDKERHFC